MSSGEQDPEPKTVRLLDLGESARPSARADPGNAERLRELIESLPQLVWTCDPDGSCDYLSRQWVEYTGVSEPVQHGLGWLEQVHPDDRPSLSQAWNCAVATGTQYFTEFRIRRHDGAYRWFDTRGVPVRDTSGRIVKWFGSNTDVDDRKRAVAALRESEERLQTVLGHMTEGLIISDLDGQLLHWNPASLALHGFSDAAEWLRHLPEFENIFELFTLEGNKLDYGDWPLPRIFRGEPVRGLEIRIRRKDIAWERIFSYSGAKVHEPNGRSLAFLTVTDLTLRQQAVDALEESEQRLRLANEAAGIGTYEINFETGRLRFSAEMCTILGLAPHAELQMSEGNRVVHPEDLPAAQRAFRATLEPGSPGTLKLDLRIVRPHGEVRWVAWSSRTFFREGAAGRVPVRAVGAAFDITELRRSELRLATQNAVSRALADSASLSEATPRIMQAICEAEGWDFGAIWSVDERAALLRCAEVWHAPQAALGELAQAMRARAYALGVGLPGRVWAGQSPLLRKRIAPDEQEFAVAFRAGFTRAFAFPILFNGKVTGVLEFLGRNVQGADDALSDTFTGIGHQLGLFFERKRAEAERHELEARLRQAQKMEAVGQLSGGIAHDFNNILGAITGNVQLALEDVAADHPVAELLTEVLKAGTRAKNLVQRILTFARRQPQERRVIAVGPVVAESIKLLRATLPAGITLNLSCPLDLPAIVGDATQIQQVVLNLVTNAWHALAADQGRIDIELRRTVLDPAEAARLTGIAPGLCAQLSVADNGHGMDAATLDRIFEPFFTTKDPGQGTGLGLSVVHGIVKAHAGAIRVASHPGRGTRFDLYFPAEPELAPKAITVPPALAQGEGQHILYVDDEEALGLLASRLFKRLGYRLTWFGRAAEAIEAFRERPQEFSLVITDMNMPELSGLQVANELLALRPDIPIVLISGNIADELRNKAYALGIKSVVYKPFDVPELTETVQRLLSAPAGSR